MKNLKFHLFAFCLFLIMAAVIILSFVAVGTEAVADTIPAITEPCEMSTEELAEALGGDLAAYAEAFLQAERMTTEPDGSCVNAAFLGAVARLESGNGKSKIAKNKNNLFGWKRHGEYQRFVSKEACIIITAQKIKKHYIDHGRTTIQSIGERYCDEEWSEIVAKMYGGMYQ